MWVPTRSTLSVLIPASIQTPRLPEDNCEACQHGWVHHQREGAPPAHSPTGYMNRGGHLPTNCGGFFSVRPTFFFFSSSNFSQDPVGFLSPTTVGFLPPAVFARPSCGLTTRTPLRIFQPRLDSECKSTTHRIQLMFRYRRPVPEPTSSKASNIFMHRTH